MAAASWGHAFIIGLCGEVMGSCTLWLVNQRADHQIALSLPGSALSQSLELEQHLAGPEAGGQWLLALFFLLVTRGQNLLAGHTQQPSEPDCRRPTALPPPVRHAKRPYSSSGIAAVLFGHSCCASVGVSFSFMGHASVHVQPALQLCRRLPGTPLVQARSE
jgi:hypothetical protein